MGADGWPKDPAGALGLPKVPVAGELGACEGDWLPAVAVPNLSCLAFNLASSSFVPADDEGAADDVGAAGEDGTAARF